MAEPKQIVFSFKEIAEALVKQQGVHEGEWGIFVKFGIQGANLGPNESGLLPTALVPILELGIQKFEKPSNLTVNAADVNPGGKVSKSPQDAVRKLASKTKKAKR